MTKELYKQMRRTEILVRRQIALRPWFPEIIAQREKMALVRKFFFNRPKTKDLLLG